MVSVDLETLTAGIAAADKTAIARALNLVEDRRPAATTLVARLLTALAGRPSGRGFRLGVTGPPGVGKSSVVAVLARALRARGLSVGVVAVDPSSVRSGGALLGDRTRMRFDPADQGLFVRSLATHGALGGLAQPVFAATQVLGAAYDVVLIETVGVGQTETQVVQVADAVALIVQPGSGDVLQFLKAGVMEVPDLLVVNKADQGAVAIRSASDLKVALTALRQVGVGHGAPKVLLLSARDGDGVEPLTDAVAELQRALSPDALRERRVQGALAIGLGWLERWVGELGLEALGGASQVRAHLQRRLAAGQSVLEAAQQLSAELCITRVTGCR